MADDPDILRIKQSEQLMLEALGIERMGSHCPCPLCKDKTALRVGLDKKGSGTYLCQCMKCGDVHGDIFKVYDQVHKKGFGQAANLLRGKLGLSPFRGKAHTNGHKAPIDIDTENVDKIVAAAQKAEDERLSEAPESEAIDADKAEKFVQFHHEYLMNSSTCVEKWMKGKRGIKEEVAEQYRLGFIENTSIQMWSKKNSNWFDFHIDAAWVFPVTDWKGNLRAIKIHNEVKSKFGKCMWLPFGVDPADRYVSYNCFWPHLYSQTKAIRPVNFTDDPLWWLSRLSNGELKDRFELRKQINAQNFCIKENKGRTDQELTPKEWNQIVQETFMDFQKEIQQDVMASGTSARPPRNIHGWTLWAPGELKAFAYISAGVQATSLTSGEGYVPTPGMLRCFRGRRVAINWDCDIPRDDGKGDLQCTGREFVHKAVDALSKTSVREVRVFTWGRR